MDEDLDFQKSKKRRQSLPYVLFDRMLDSEESHDTPRSLHIWVSPVDTPVPLTRNPVRIAVGTPEGRSSNAWRMWSQGTDVYVACRDNFQEFKVSLHASGIWRVAFTENILKDRSELAIAEGNRVIHRRQADFKDTTRALVGFQIVVLRTGLYLNPSNRREWPNSVAFVEPPSSKSELTILSIVVLPAGKSLVSQARVRWAPVAQLLLVDGRSVQIVATHEPDEEMKRLIRNAYGPSSSNQQSDLPDDAVFVVWGHRTDETPWFSAVRYTDVVAGLI